MSSNPTSATWSVSSESGGPTTASSSTPRTANRARSNPVTQASSGGTKRVMTQAERDVRSARSRPEVTGRNPEATNQPRAAYVEKRDRPLPPSGRGSTGVSAENPMEPKFDGDETYCCNAEGEIICFRVEDSKGQLSWRNVNGRFAKAPTDAEWRVHNAGGKSRWNDKKMQNLGKDMV